MKTHLLLYILMMFGCSSRLEAMTQLHLQDGFNEIKLPKGLNYFFDSRGALSLAEVSAPESAAIWQNSEQETISLGYRTGALWLRFQIEDSRSHPTESVLQLAYPQTDYVNLYSVQDGTIESFEAGDHLIKSRWALDARMPAFPLSPVASRIIYLKVWGSTSIQVPLIIRTRNHYQEFVSAQESAQALYYGALIAIGIYNLLLFVGTRIKVYGYYVLYLFGYCLFQASLGGQGYHYVWRDAILLNEFMLFFAIGLTGLASTSFSIALLDLQKNSTIPKYTFRYLVASMGTTFVFYFGSGYTNALKFMFVFVVGPWLVFLVYAGVKGALQRERVAKWYLIAWSAFIVGSLVTLLRQEGILPSTNLTQNAQQIGSAIEFILLSFALADRIKDLQKRVEEEQATSLAANQRALTEERRLSELRDQMVANTSHELRTPLNGMMGLVQAVIRREQGGLSNESKRSLDNTITCGKRMASLIGDLLDFSRGQRNEIPLYRVPIQLKEMLALIFDLLQPTVTDKAVIFRDFTPDNLPALNADPDRLQQILFNLLGNAIKFTQKGQISVSAMVDSNYVTIRISDTGPGIAADKQEQIFEPFLQADGGISRQFGGTGLGLAVVKQLVKAHQGEVGVNSVLGYGASFWFTMPVHQQAAETNIPLSPALSDKLVALQSQLQTKSQLEIGSPRQSPGPANETTHLAKNRLRILVVDDEPMNVQVLVEILELGGHQISTAANGQAALEKLETETAPDLVILDVMMPGISGFEVLQIIRNRFNEAELPVIIMTAKALERDLVQAFSLGATDYILKPFSVPEVEARIAHLIRLQTAIWTNKVSDEERKVLRHNMLQVESHLLHTERLATLGALTGTVVHDLVNPLDHIRTLLGWISQQIEELSAAEYLDSRCRPNLASIKESTLLAENAVSIAEELANALRMSIRIDNGSAELLAIDQVLQSVLGILSGKLKYLDVQVNVETGLTVIGKHSELIQLLMNLISNAADATAENGAKTLVITANNSQGFVHVLIEDSGIGIPDSIRNQIFEPFFTTKHSSKGTGLGLFVVKTISQRMQAQIKIAKSERLGGACFELEIPAA